MTVPKNRSEIKSSRDLEELANQYGFVMEKEYDGQYVLYTDLYSTTAANDVEEDDSLREGPED